MAEKNLQNRRKTGKPYRPDTSKMYPRLQMLRQLELSLEVAEFPVNNISDGMHTKQLC